MKARSKSAQTIASQLSSGYGAQRLPSSLRAIEIHDIPSRGALKGQRGFMKDILPRIKFHNDQLSVVTAWRKIPDRKKRAGKDKETSSNSETSPGAASKTERSAPLIRLHFYNLPAKELFMEDKSSIKIASDLIALIEKTTGKTVITAEEVGQANTFQDGEEDRSLSEEVASDSIPLAADLSTSKLDLSSNINTSNQPS